MQLQELFGLNVELCDAYDIKQSGQLEEMRSPMEAPPSPKRRLNRSKTFRKAKLPVLGIGSLSSVLVVRHKLMYLALRKHGRSRTVCC